MFGITDVGIVVMEPEVVVQDGKSGMIEFEEMLETSGTFVAGHFDVMNLNRRDVNGLRGSGSTEAEFGEG